MTKRSAPIEESSKPTKQNRSITDFFKSSTTTALESSPLVCTWSRPFPSLLQLTVGTPPSNEEPCSKLAIFDLDGTWIKTRGSHIFSKHPEDWMFISPTVPTKLRKLKEDGFRIVVFSNQLGLGNKPETVPDFKQKLENVARDLKIDFELYAATENDMYRKPMIGMWEYYLLSHAPSVQKDALEECFYVGDAAGRDSKHTMTKKKDHSCFDRKFALNAGLDFYTPEEFFLGHSKAPYSIGFDPKLFIEEAKSVPVFTPTSGALVPEDGACEMVIMVGYPAGGKTTFCKKYLEPQGYVRVNQDELKTRDKCIAAAKQSLEAGKSVVIGNKDNLRNVKEVDNTNPDRASRATFIEVAMASKVPVRCFYVTSSEELAQHCNQYRAIRGDRDKIPTIAYRNFSSRFQEPTMDEGFSEIKRIQLVPDFESDHHRDLFCRYY